MSYPVTNQTASPSLKGQCAVVTLTQAAANAYLEGLETGTLCTAASGKIGYVQSVDVEGHTFKVRPQYPDGMFDSTATPGILNVSEVITVG